MTDGFLSYICVVVYFLRTAASRSHGRLSIIRLCTCTSIVHTWCIYTYIQRVRIGSRNRRLHSCRVRSTVLIRQGIGSFDKFGLSYHHLTQRLSKTALKTGWISIRIRADVQRSMCPQISHKLPTGIRPF